MRRLIIGFVMGSFVGAGRAAYIDKTTGKFYDGIKFAQLTTDKVKTRWNNAGPTFQGTDIAAIKATDPTTCLGQTFFCLDCQTTGIVACTERGMVDLGDQGRIIE